MDDVREQFVARIQALLDEYSATMTMYYDLYDHCRVIVEFDDPEIEDIVLLD